MFNSEYKGNTWDSIIAYNLQFYSFEWTVSKKRKAITFLGRGVLIVIKIRRMSTLIPVQNIATDDVILLKKNGVKILVENKQEHKDTLFFLMFNQDINKNTKSISMLINTVNNF